MFLYSIFVSCNVIAFRTPRFELILQCIAALREQQLAGKTFNDALERVLHIYGAKTLIIEAARKCWTLGEKNLLLFNDANRMHAFANERIELCRCIFNETNVVINEMQEQLNPAALRVIDGRYVYCYGRQDSSFAVVDLFHNKMA